MGGANLEQTDGSLKTALNYAAKANSRKCLELLIKAGADVNHRRKYGGNGFNGCGKA